ncbi:MAG: hypothetical protein JXX14_23325 [Deltaproteobacteria bacterium]|nr:hypothetical protein [Deltaproteobacteria bacterium]
MKRLHRPMLVIAALLTAVCMPGCNSARNEKQQQVPPPKGKKNTQESTLARLKAESATNLGALAEYVAETHLSGEYKSDWINYAAYVFALSKNDERAKELFKRAQWAKYSTYNITLPAEVGYVEDTLAAIQKMKKQNEKDEAMGRLIPFALANQKEALITPQLNRLSPKGQLSAYISAARRCVQNVNMACAKQYFEKAADIGKTVLDKNGNNTTKKEIATIAIDVHATDAHPWLFDDLHPLSVVDLIDNAIQKNQVPFAETLSKKINRYTFESVEALTLLANSYHTAGDSKKFDVAYSQALKKVSGIREKCRRGDAAAMVAGLARLKGDEKQKAAHIAMAFEIIKSGAHFGSGFECLAAQEPFRRLAHGGICDVQVANADLLPDWKSEPALMSSVARACIEQGDMENGMAIFNKADELDKSKYGKVYCSDVFKAWLELGEFDRAKQYLAANSIDPLHRDVMFVISNFVYGFIRKGDFNQSSQETKALTTMLHTFFVK